ncbi:hypothetical protein [Pontimicrobium sp. IMCC45349]|uniref:hypothetical protein n=1 Tax=Pontimicrobium sp. IMCC45349 TaxID=3391574 RepID=UPI0039A3410D
MEDKKTVWSLQKNKRTQEERDVFKPTGKAPKNKTLSYVIWAIVMLFAASFSLTFLQEDAIDVCITSTFCFNSKDSIGLFALYIFINIVVIVFAILGAYIIGKKIGDKFKL